MDIAVGEKKGRGSLSNILGEKWRLESFSDSVTLYTDEVSAPFGAVGYAQFLGETSKRVAFKKLLFNTRKPWWVFNSSPIIL